MAVRTWQTVKTIFCAHAGALVSLQAETVYPSERLPEQAPRVLGHRCSHGIECNLDDHASCVWAGTNPLVDPFAEED